MSSSVIPKSMNSVIQKIGIDLDSGSCSDLRVDIAACCEAQEPWWSGPDLLVISEAQKGHLRRFLIGFGSETLRDWGESMWNTVLSVTGGCLGQAVPWRITEPVRLCSQSEDLALDNRRRMIEFTSRSVSAVLDGLDLDKAIRAALDGVIERFGEAWLKPLRELQSNPEKLDALFSLLDRTGEAEELAGDQSLAVEAAASSLAPGKASEIRELGVWARMLERLRRRYVLEFRERHSMPRLTIRLDDGERLEARRGGRVSRSVVFAPRSVSLRDRFTLDIYLPKAARVYLFSVSADPMEPPRLLTPRLDHLDRTPKLGPGGLSFPRAWGIDFPMRLDPSTRYGDSAWESFLAVFEYQDLGEWLSLSPGNGALRACGVIEAVLEGQNHPCWVNWKRLLEMPPSSWSMGMIQFPVRDDSTS